MRRSRLDAILNSSRGCFFVRPRAQFESRSTRTVKSLAAVEKVSTACFPVSSLPASRRELKERRPRGGPNQSIEITQHPASCPLLANWLLHEDMALARAVENALRWPDSAKTGFVSAPRSKTFQGRVFLRLIESRKILRLRQRRMVKTFSTVKVLGLITTVAPTFSLEPSGLGWQQHLWSAKNALPRTPSHIFSQAAAATPIRVLVVRRSRSICSNRHR